MLDAKLHFTLFTSQVFIAGSISSLLSSVMKSIPSYFYNNNGLNLNYRDLPLVISCHKAAMS